jgi:Mg-chelatase subunit ChlI
LLELCNTFIGHIGRLELELEKNKPPHNVSTSDETFELIAELKELKEDVFIDETCTNAGGDVPVGLTQVYWDTGNRRVISWDTIHKLAAEQGGTNVEDNGTKRVVNAVVNTTSVKEGRDQGEDKSDKTSARTLSDKEDKAGKPSAQEGKQEQKASAKTSAKAKDKRQICTAM